MFGPRIDIIKLAGFPLRIDLSWLFIAILVTWSLASAYFPMQYPNLSQGTYLIMGLVGMFGLFGSVVLHELGHAIVARRFNLEIRGITLFLFGGVAEMAEEPKSAKAEFWVAVGGPIVSLLLALALIGINLISFSTPVEAVITYLATINAIVLVFNLIPAFPLDGGRVLRAAIWYFGKSMRKATRISSQIGSVFGMVLVGLGLLQLVSGMVVSAIWLAILGFFLRGAAVNSYQQLLIRRLLEGEPVRRFMNDTPVTVDAAMSLEDVVDQYIYKHHHKAFPVVGNDRKPIGLISTREIKNVSRDVWKETRVEDFVEPLNEENCISPNADAMQALALMNRTGKSRFLVVDKGRLAGIITLKDLMKFLTLKVELEEDGDSQEIVDPRIIQAQITQEKRDA